MWFERLESVRWKDVIKLFRSDNLPRACLTTPNGASCKGEELFFFMMGDGVGAAAGAERPDVFSEMTAASPLVRARRRLWEHTHVLAVWWVSEPRVIVLLVYSQLEAASRSGQMAAVVNSAPHQKQECWGDQGFVSIQGRFSCTAPNPSGFNLLCDPIQYPYVRGPQ